MIHGRIRHSHIIIKKDNGGLLDQSKVRSSFSSGGGSVLAVVEESADDASEAVEAGLEIGRAGAGLESG